ncbi:ATP-dependent RNA helicase ddx54 [Musca vetustissima]|uniref:ATP-dependent RNA helicase ddx54 n=1 Tax=Musca vetustissima TaxID=27455 RepID=UPI002AB7229A|nr:ATP-dependent RNA helicase ddx54 [Musca vetustissima]
MSLLLLALAALMPNVHSWSAIPAAAHNSINNGHQRNEVSPYLDLVLCPIRNEPWSCARQQSGRILDIWDNELHSQWQKLKVEADQQLNATLERRGYSASDLVIKEKPSTILKKIEIGTNYMKEYVADTLDGFLGREYDYIQNFKVHNDIQNDQPASDNDEVVDENENDDETDDEDEGDDTDNDNGDEEGDDEGDEDGDVKNTAIINDNASNGNEFIEIESQSDGEHTGTGDVKDANDRRRKKKNQNKKKGSQHDIPAQAANLLIVQPLEHHLEEAEHHVEEVVHKVKPGKRKIKPIKEKRRKRKKKGQALGDDTTTIVVEQEPASDLGLGLLDALSDVDILQGGGKRKKRPLKYGRSIGVTRGKKKKKKKAIQKFILLGSFLKAKIELLLKILGAHLQIKFFAIALIGLLINIARFWIDVKRGGVPQKVVYVEHAHHQHHYEDHGEDWSESGGGGYWKRSLQTDTPLDEYDSSTDSYQPRPVEPQQAYDAQYMAYRNQWQRK